MIEDKTDNVQVRRFEVNGVERAQVKYDRDRDLFLLQDHSIGEELEFDNIDFIAVEVLELTQPVLPERDNEDDTE
jgi:uncharacterized protein YkuJ